MVKKSLNIVIGLLSIGLLLVSFECNAYSQMDDFGEEIVSLAQSLGGSNKQVREVLALLLPENIDVIYILKKLDLSEEKIWSLYHSECGDDIAAFASSVRNYRDGHQL